MASMFDTYVSKLDMPRSFLESVICLRKICMEADAVVQPDPVGKIVQNKSASTTNDVPGKTSGKPEQPVKSGNEPSASTLNSDIKTSGNVETTPENQKETKAADKDSTDGKETSDKNAEDKDKKSGDNIITADKLDGDKLLTMFNQFAGARQADVNKALMQACGDQNAKTIIEHAKSYQKSHEPIDVNQQFSPWMKTGDGKQLDKQEAIHLITNILKYYGLKSTK